MRKHWEVTAIWCSGFPSSIYMWTVDSESFKEPLWNVPDSHGESLLLLKCFVFSSFPGAPDILCECWKIRGIFSVCFSISREVRTKRQSAFAVYSARVLQFASQKLFVQINKIKKEKKRLDKERRCSIPFTSPRIYCVFLISQLISSMTRLQPESNQFFPLISEIICPSRRGLVRDLIISLEINIS